MTSLSTVSASIVPVTEMLDGCMGWMDGAWADAKFFSGGVTYNYLAASGVDTALNVTGSGVITFLSFGSNAVSTSGNMTVTIDGTEVLNDTRGSIKGQGILPVGGVYIAGNYLTCTLGHVPFKSSLVVTIECDVNAYLTYGYYKT